MPHSPISRPSYSSSSLTRIPMLSLSAYQTSRLAAKTQANIVAAPIIWPLKLESPLVIGTSSKPNRPMTPCTEIAPTGSSIFRRSIPTILNTTMIPAIRPNNVACSAVGVDGSAVMATNPASAPFKAMVRSAFPNSARAVNSAATKPAAAAALVFKNTIATECALLASASLRTEPPLKPNQPIHKMNVPRVASGKFAPGMATGLPSRSYLPFLEPSSSTPARAAAAPAICTIPEPAKSLKPRSPRLNKPKTSLPPQVHAPSIG